MGFIEKIASFAIAKSIVCKNGAEAVSFGELLRVSWNGRKALESSTIHYCAKNCSNGTICQLSGLKRILNPIVQQNTRQ